MFLFYNRFGQAGGFIKLRDRFDAIMGFQKPDLTTSVNSEEKVSTEITEKEIEESRINKIDGTESVTVVAERSGVCKHFILMTV